MKNVMRSVLMVLVAVAFAVGMAGCGAVGGGDSIPLAAGPSNPPAKTIFSVSGTFDGKKFSLASENNYVASRAAVTSGSYPIKGELEDGDIIFRLTGTYDPVARNYIASAASSIIRYSISGAFDASGADLGSTATVATKSGDSWVPVTYVVTKEEVTISDTKPILGVDEVPGEHEVVTSGGIPSWAQGWWSWTESWGSEKVNVKALFSEWSIMQEVVFTSSEGIDYDSQTCTVIKAEERSANVWDVILSYPVYVATQAQAFAAVQQYITAKKDSVTGRIKTMMENPTALNAAPSNPPDGYWWTIFEGPVTDENGTVISTFYSFAGNMPMNVQDEYFEYLYTPPSPTPFANLAAAKAHAQAWLTSKGYSYPYYEFTPMPEGLIYWFEDGGIQVSINWGMESPTPAEEKTFFKLSDEFYITNYLEKYLISQHVSPVSKYAKIQVTFTSNRTKMTARNYYDSSKVGNGNPYEWDTLNGATSVTTIEPDMVDGMPTTITLSR